MSLAGDASSSHANTVLGAIVDFKFAPIARQCDRRIVRNWVAPRHSPARTPKGTPLSQWQTIKSAQVTHKPSLYIRMRITRHPQRHSRRATHQLSRAPASAIVEIQASALEAFTHQLAGTTRCRPCSRQGQESIGQRDSPRSAARTGPKAHSRWSSATGPGTRRYRHSDARHAGRRSLAGRW